MNLSERRRRAAAEAAGWFVRLESGQLAREEREQFVDWLRESHVHVAEMLRVAKVHDALEKFNNWGQINTDGPDIGEDNIVALAPAPKPDLPPAPSKHSKRVWVSAIAATLAAVALLGILFFPLKRGQTIETERGERREMTLADGSVLEIDPQTRIRVAFEEHTRRVVLERGRALFRVAKNPVRPFLVQADGTTVRAVGTAFGVERQPQGVLVTVAEGRVGVSSRQQVGGGETAGGASDSSSGAMGKAAEKQPVKVKEVLLTAGQQVRMAPGSAQPVRAVDSDRELAWAKGRLIFDNETVAEAVEAFNRYNRVQLKVADEALGSRPVSGVFDASDPQSFIAFLQTVTSVHVTQIAGEITMQ
jgi:transmembrane sensor